MSLLLLLVLKHEINRRENEKWKNNNNKLIVNWF